MTKDVTPKHIPSPSPVREALTGELVAPLEITRPAARLLDMLTYKRPAGSATEAAFIERFIIPTGAQPDAFGNYWLEVLESDGSRSPIMWSGHTDTVHHSPGRQRVRFEGPMVMAVTKPRKGRRKRPTNCLGADDAAGVWLMLEMIAAGVPGLYAFHREEECGGGGSRYAAERAAADGSLGHIRTCIAWDRKGYDSVITHQGSRCASDAFARSLAAILGGEFKPDDTGLFTDSANYTDVIGECTNLSVGYFAQHGPLEAQNLPWLMALRDTVLAADWSGLVFERQPGERGDWGLSRWERFGSPYGGGWARWGTGDYGGGGSYRPPGGVSLPFASLDLERFVRRHAAHIADLLESDGWTAESLGEFFGIDPEECV